VQISPANTYPGLTKPWDTGEPEIYRPSGEINYFRTNAADDAQGWAGAAWAQCLGYENVYILHDLQLYGQGLADAFEQRADEIGLAIAGREGVDSIDTDFQALLTNVRESGADLVYGGFVIDSGGPQVIQQMFDLGLFDDGTDFMGPDGLVNPALVDEIGGADVGSGQIVLTFPGLAPSQLTSEAGLRFLENFQEEYAYEPSAWSTYAYQSMQVALYAIEQAGEADRGAILEAVRNIDEFEGITGTFGFDENGDPTLTAMGGNIVEEGEIIFQGSISPNMNESCDM